MSTPVIPIPVGPGPYIPPTPKPINPLGPGGTQQIFDFSKSNLILMIGGQILILVLALMVVFFGTAPLSFPANAMRNMLSRRSLANKSG
jgi:hypothetical protein